MGRLHMETMGSVFFHLCSQTCPGQGLQAARMWPEGWFLEEGWRLAATLGRCPLVLGWGRVEWPHLLSMKN